MHTVINNQKIHFNVKGSGEPFLLVHGWGGSSMSLEKLAANLSAHYKVYTLDLPGFGKSPLPPENWGFDEYADVVAEFIKFLESGSINYFGHSFGGGIGIYLAANQPLLIKHLVLAGAAYDRSPVVSRTAKLVNKYATFYPRIKRYLRPIRVLYYRLRYPRADIIKRFELEEVFRKVISRDLKELVSKISARTLIVWGRKDADTPPAQAEFLDRKIPDSELVMFEDASHNLPLVMPCEVANVILKFTKK